MKQEIIYLIELQLEILNEFAYSKHFLFGPSILISTLFFSLLHLSYPSELRICNNFHVYPFCPISPYSSTVKFKKTIAQSVPIHYQVFSLFFQVLRLQFSSFPIFFSFPTISLSSPAPCSSFPIIFLII